MEKMAIKNRESCRLDWIGIPAGIAVGSLSTSSQGLAVVTGSYFAIAQSTGALEPGVCAIVGTKVGLPSGISGAATGIAGVFTWVAGNGMIKQFKKT